ncbi:MAG TPA: ABC transporter substrate-binding protein [Verrucomicrobiae bacterium]|jgi:peptide/nickel transport system substrate-binding protein|nr:ABC transporter substrate-binding protein [Verrucomicrobiae bacterium]
MARARGIGLAFVVLLASTGIAWAQGGTLRVGLPSVSASLDPATALEGPVSVIARQMFDTLVQYRDVSSDIEPGLAARWSVSRDGLVWTFRLRDGVRFHDGTALTAQHVVESLDRVLQPSAPHAPTPNAAARLVRGTPGVVKEVRAVDPRTVQVSLLLPYAPLPAVLAHPAFSIVLVGGPGQRWIGTGPFALTEASAGRVVLDAYPAYWAGAPRSSRLIFLDSGENGRGEALLDAQAADVALMDTAPERPSGVLSVPGWRIGYLALETEKEPFNRVKARQAVAAALDPGQIAPAVGSVGVPLLAFLPLGVWGRRDTPVVEASTANAKRLLAEAGYPRGTSAGLLIAEGGKRLDQARLGEAVRASLAAAGISVPIQSEAPDAALQLARTGQHQMALLEARVEAGDPHFLLYPLSSSEGASKGAGAVNMSFYRNRTLDDLLIRASQVSFRPERQRLYARAQSMLAEAVPWIPLYVRMHWAAVRPELRNLRLHPSGNPRLDRVWVDQALPPASPVPSGGR